MIGDGQRKEAAAATTTPQKQGKGKGKGKKACVTRHSGYVHMWLLSDRAMCKSALPEEEEEEEKEVVLCVTHTNFHTYIHTYIYILKESSLWELTKLLLLNVKVATITWFILSVTADSVTKKDCHYVVNESTVTLRSVTSQEKPQSINKTRIIRILFINMYIYNNFMHSVLTLWFHNLQLFCNFD